MRFSTNPGDILDDAISVPRGLALKILDAYEMSSDFRAAFNGCPIHEPKGLAALPV